MIASMMKAFDRYALTYFLALAITPEGNFGKGRYLMRTSAPKLIAEL